MFKIMLLIILASTVVCSAVYFVKGTPRELWINSIPTDNYVEVSFDNWLDWFMIAPNKWDFKKYDYDNDWCFLNEKRAH